MKIDLQYLKKLLIAFEESESPETLVKDLQEHGFDKNSPNFIFHMRILDDNHLICRVDMRPGFGYEISTQAGRTPYVWHDYPLRLTARGHDFIADLRQREVWNSIKSDFKDASMSTLIDAAKQLGKGILNKKLKDLTGFDPD